MKKAKSNKTTDDRSLKFRLIEAALNEIKARGAHNLSLRQIAAQVGCSPMASYRHFSSKEALIAAIAEEGFELLRSEMVEGMAQYPSDPLKQIEAAGDRYIKLALKRPEHLLMMFGNFIENFEQFESLHAAGNSAFFALVDLMKKCQAAGELPKVDPIKQAVCAWSIVHGFSMLIINGNLEFLGINLKNYESYSHFVSQSVLSGIRNLPNA